MNERRDDKALRLWREQIKETDDITALRARAATLTLERDKTEYIAAKVAFEEHEEKQASERHDAQMKKLDDAVDAQQEGNSIQRWIFGALVVAPLLTIVVMIALAMAAKGAQ